MLCEDWNSADIARLDSKTEACRAPHCVAVTKKQQAEEESSQKLLQYIFFFQL